MNITLIEPFFSGSHKRWALAYQQFSQHPVDILSLPGRHWKWRMHGGAISLAQQYLKAAKKTDLILVSDMLDLTTFIALCRKEIADIPIAIYFHENQLTYPWSADDPDVSLQRDRHYAFINYTSALTADAVFFNSKYHQHSFLEALPKFLRQFPDHAGVHNADIIRTKSRVLPLALDLKTLDTYQQNSVNEQALILWNHRWEYDKAPEPFFRALFQLAEEGIPFQLAVLGESYAKVPPIFKEAKIRLADQLVQFGQVDSLAAYAKWLWKADILPVSSQQDFFGGSVVEAIYCGCFPILPNRLAYPEHIPADFKVDCLYNDEVDFYQKLRRQVLGFKELSFSNKLQNFVAQYDWRNLGPAYDNAFAQVGSTNGTTTNQF